jgi:hypothetical protein
MADKEVKKMRNEKPRCPDYTQDCHNKLGVVYCRDGSHNGKVRCPVIVAEVDEEE